MNIILFLQRLQLKLTTKILIVLTTFLNYVVNILLSLLYLY